jgi:hypothetical protein
MLCRETNDISCFRSDPFCEHGRKRLCWDCLLQYNKEKKWRAEITVEVKICSKCKEIKRLVALLKHHIIVMSFTLTVGTVAVNKESERVLPACLFPLQKLCLPGLIPWFWPIPVIPLRFNYLYIWSFIQDHTAIYLWCYEQQILLTNSRTNN